MKEHEMREIVRELLGRTVRRVVVPASLGIGLALAGGCDHRAVPVQSDGAAEQQEADIGVPMRYATPFPSPDAGMRRDLSRDKAPTFPNLPGNVTMYGMPFPEQDAGVGLKYGAPFPAQDAAVGGKYGTPFPSDAG